MSELPTPYPSQTTRHPKDAGLHLQIACHWLGLNGEAQTISPTPEQVQYARHHLRETERAAEEMAQKLLHLEQGLSDLSKLSDQFPKAQATELQAAVWRLMAGGTVFPSPPETP